MPLTIEQIIEEAKQLPREQLAEVVDDLTLMLNGGGDPEIEKAWIQECRRRVAEIEAGKARLIPGEEVLAKARAIAGL